MVSLFLSKDRVDERCDVLERSHDHEQHRGEQEDCDHRQEPPAAVRDQELRELGDSRKLHAALLRATTQSSRTRKSRSLRRNVAYASTGEATIGSSFRFIEVLSKTPIPVRS